MKTKEEYEIELKDLENYIQDLWAFNKRSKTKERRLEEVKTILLGLEADKEIKNVVKARDYYRKLLIRNHIIEEDDYYEESNIMFKEKSVEETLKLIFDDEIKYK